MAKSVQICKFVCRRIADPQYANLRTPANLYVGARLAFGNKRLPDDVGVGRVQAREPTSPKQSPQNHGAGYDVLWLRAIRVV